MKSLLLTAAAAAAITLAGCSTMMPAKPPVPMADATRMAPAYVQAAGASDLYEITSSQSVLGSAQNPDVRRYAQMMIDHHTMTTRDVMAAAKAAGMSPPPPAPDTRKAAMLDELKAASGAARERLYVSQQVMAHEEALALHSGYAASGDRPELQAVAAKAVPIIQQHLTEIRRIQGMMP